MNNKKFEHAELRLSIISPTNIAESVELTPYDYLYDPKTGMVYYLNHLLWHKFIISRDLFEKYESYITNAKGTLNLLEWLQDNGCDLNDVDNAIVGKTQAIVNILNPEEKKSVNNVFAMLRDAQGKIIVPGSSIKGFVRTALMYRLLRNNKSVKDKYWAEVSRILLDKSKIEEKDVQRLDKCAKNLEEELLHKLNLQDQRGKPVSQDNALASSMRGILISDAKPVNEIETAILQKIDLVIEPEKKENKISVFRECMLPGSELSFSITIDKTITKTIGVNSVQDIVDACDEFQKYVVSLLSEGFAKAFPEVFRGIESANLYLGANTGFLTKTLLAALAPTDAKAVPAIRNWLNFAFPEAKHMAKDKSIAPRTFKATIYNGEYIPMGLAEVSKL